MPHAYATQDPSELELHYHQITDLYDLAEDLIATVEHESMTSPEGQLYLVEPLIEQIGESADILCEEFIEVAGKGQRQGARKARIEGALRKIYMAMDAYKERVRAVTVQTASGIRNIADPIVEKVKYQVEVIISILVDFIDLSLDRIMHRQQIDELRRRQERIAQMLLATERQQGFDMGA